MTKKREDAVFLPSQYLNINDFILSSKLMKNILINH